MTWRVRFTEEARDDLERLYGFLLAEDADAAERALETIERAMTVLRTFPFSCRKAAVPSEEPFLRELVIPFGNTGYVALFEITDDRWVTVLAVRHQREADFY